MLVNLHSLKITANDKFLRIFIVSDQMVHQATQETVEWRKSSAKYPKELIFSIGPELDFMLECIRGTAPFYPWFADGLNHIMIAPDGIRLLRAGESRDNEHWFTFPAKAILSHIDRVLHLAKHQPADRWGSAGNAVVVIPQATLNTWKVQYGPKYTWEYQEQYSDWPDIQDKIALDLVDTRQTRLDTCLDGLVRIAKNSSDGIKSRIIIRYDTRPTYHPASYFFNIISGRTGKSTMHGGIIAHARYENNDRSTPPISWEYSTHT